MQVQESIIESNSLIDSIIDSISCIDSAAAHEYSYILMTLVMRDVTVSNVATTAVINLYNLVRSAVDSTSLVASNTSSYIKLSMPRN